MTMIDTDRVAPTARGRICVDFDLTLVHWGPLDEIPEPLPHAVDAIRRLLAAGYEVVILTSRLSPTWWREHCHGTDTDPERFGDHQAFVVERALERMGLPALRVTSEKVPALAYIDDRAIAFGGDWHEVLRVVPGVTR